MDITSKLLSSYDKINKHHESNNLSGQSLVLRNFQILGEFLIIALAERFDLLNSSLSFLEKHEIIIKKFRSICVKKIDNFYSSFYSEINEIFQDKAFNEFIDPLGMLYQRKLTDIKKQNKGIVFTPISVVDYILEQLNYPKTIDKPESERLIDLACGSGLFLSRAVRRICILGKEEQKSAEEIVQFVEKTIFGFDIDPVAVLLSKINILVELFNTLGKEFPIEKISSIEVHRTNSMVRENNSDSNRVKNIKKNKFNYVVGNPPYIESKKMDLKTKNICKENFPEYAKRHYDIYALFLMFGTELLQDNGQLGFIIPNKFLISRFARQFREIFLEENIISQILDLAHQKVFNPAVYPIILLLDKKRKNNDLMKIITNVEIDELETPELHEKINYVNPNFFKKTVNKTIYFPQNNAFPLLDRIFSLSEYSLGDIIRFRWSISFHRKGLREKFVSKVPKGENPQKFLGGKPFGGNREVERYKTTWNGYWLDYNQEESKRLKNNFQDLKYFKEKKIIICQHALRMRATIDTEGYACKDIFLLGHLRDIAKQQKLSLEFVLGLLNSKLYSFLYNIMFSGSEIMGKYLHYLPTFLHDLPILIPTKENQSLMEKYVNLMLQKNDEKIDLKIDELVYKMYGCSESEISAVERHISTHLVK